MTKFPCPICGKYYEPYMTRKDGKAMLECPTHGLYETSIAVSKNFRLFCSKLGSKPNRESWYYTSSEFKVKRYLDKAGLVEGLDYFHNNRVPVEIDGKERYFWPDFTVPAKKLIIGASPAIWHRMWARNKADDRFTEIMKKLGWKTIHLDEKDLQKLNKRRKKDKYPRPERCKELDSIFGVVYEV